MAGSWLRTAAAEIQPALSATPKNSNSWSVFCRCRSTFFVPWLAGFRCCRPARQRFVDAPALKAAANVTLAPLPLYSPELNPVERVWEYLKERSLSLRLLNDYDAIADAASKAWNRMCAEVGRNASLSSYPWITRVKP
jgi:hypothetical protein